MTNDYFFRIINLMSNFSAYIAVMLANSSKISGGVEHVKNLSTKKTPEKERAWFQKKNENCFRQKNFIKQTQKRQKEIVSVKAKAESKRQMPYAFCLFYHDYKLIF